MKYVPMWLARWVDDHLSFKSKLRFVGTWRWISSPVSTLKYEWQMYKDRKAERRVRKFLREQSMNLEDYL